MKKVNGNGYVVIELSAVLNPESDTSQASELLAFVKVLQGRSPALKRIGKKLSWAMEMRASTPRVTLELTELEGLELLVMLVRAHPRDVLDVAQNPGNHPLETMFKRVFHCVAKNFNGSDHFWFAQYLGASRQLKAAPKSIKDFSDEEVSKEMGRRESLEGTDTGGEFLDFCLRAADWMRTPQAEDSEIPF